MKMTLIQPFISAADSVLSSALGAPACVGDLSMETEGYRRKGVAAVIEIRGEIEGRVILDMERATAENVARQLAGAEVSDSSLAVCEAICELANMVIGNAVTLLNDHGFQFKVLPPEIHDTDEPVVGAADVESMAIHFDTSCGRVFLNIAMRYNVKQSPVFTAARR